MKKKLLIGTILPSIAALAVIGSGFSLWIFNDSNSVETTGSVGINVTKVLDITNSSIGLFNSTNSVLKFDQTNTSLNKINPKGNGLWWSDNTREQEAIQTAMFTLNDPTDTNSATAYDSSVNYTFTTTITLSEVLASYVKLSFITNKDNTSNTWDDGEWKDAVINNDKSVTYTYTFDSKNTLGGATKDQLSFQEVFWFANVTPTYQAGMEPTTLGESETTEHSYLKLLKDVKDESISVTYEVKASIEA